MPIVNIWKDDSSFNEVYVITDGWSSRYADLTDKEISWIKQTTIEYEKVQDFLNDKIRYKQLRSDGEWR